MMEFEFSDKNLFFGVGLATLLLLISWIDFCSLRIPNILNIMLAVGGVFWQLFELSNVQILFQLGAAIVLAGVLYVVRHLYFKHSGKHGLGFGDVKMTGAAGIWIAPVNYPFFLFFSSFSGLIFALCMNGINRGKMVAFGPFLAIGLYGTWLWENMV